MPSSISALFVASLSILTAACGGASGPSFRQAKVRETESAIYVYRLDDECLSDSAPEVFLDDKSIGILRNDGYLLAMVEPKVHTLKIDGSDNMELGMYVDPDKGEERFVKWMPVCQEGAGTATFMANMREVEHDEALTEISSTRLSR